MSIAPTKPERLPITVVNGKLTVPHLGLSFRSAMGAAITHRKSLIPGSAPHRFPVFYKDVQIAEISLGKDFR